MMTTFIIYHDQSQGVLMRALTAVSRRGLAFVYVKDPGGTLTLILDVNEKTTGQLLRDWRATIGVTFVEIF